MATITFHANDQIEAALRDLAGREGTPRSEVIRQAILAAHRAQQREQLRAEAEQMANDPEDLAEVAAIQAEMAELRAW